MQYQFVIYRCRRCNRETRAGKGGPTKGDGMVWHSRCLWRIAGGRSVHIPLRIGTVPLGRHCGQVHVPLGMHRRVQHRLAGNEEWDNSRY